MKIRQVAVAVCALGISGVLCLNRDQIICFWLLDWIFGWVLCITEGKSNW